MPVDRQIVQLQQPKKPNRQRHYYVQNTIFAKLLSMAESISEVLASAGVKNGAINLVNKISNIHFKSTLSGIYSNLCKYAAMNSDTVMSKRFSVLMSNTGSSSEIGVKVASEEIIFYGMCGKFRGMDAQMEFEPEVVKGVKRRVSERLTAPNTTKKNKLSID